MALNLYRRHFRTAGKCLGGSEPDSRNYETDELRRGWKKCRCPIYADGTLGEKFKRKNTRQTTWQEAKAVAGAWEAAGRWDKDTCAPTAPLPAVDSVVCPPEGVTIERVAAAFLAEHAEMSAPNTQKKYALMLNKFKAHAAAKGYVMIDQWGPIDVREFRQSWAVSPITSAKNMSIVKAFFEFALSNEWIMRNPARLVKNPRGRAGSHPRRKEQYRFSDEELRRMFEACATQYGKKPVRWSRKVHHQQPSDQGEIVNYKYKWTGQDLADFIFVSVYTGLRISDVCTFHIDRLRPNGECHIRTTKNGRKVFTWVPEWLQQRIRARAEQYGPLIFGEHSTRDTNVVTDVWRRKLKRLWNLCGPWPEKPMPHRFRHTFARILLQRPNVTVRDVAELLGDTEDMVRRHYAAWVTERQERLTNVLKEAFSEKPTPKFVEAPLDGRYIH